MTPITGPGGLHADGSDIALIDVEAVDAKGDRCSTLQQRVDFEMEGPGVWRRQCCRSGVIPFSKDIGSGRHK